MVCNFLILHTAREDWLNRLIHDVLLPHQAVSRVHSQIVMDQLKQDGPLPT